MANSNVDETVCRWIVRALFEREYGLAFARSLEGLYVSLGIGELDVVSQEEFGSALRYLAEDSSEKCIDLWYPYEVDGKQGIAVHLRGLDATHSATSKTRKTRVA